MSAVLQSPSQRRSRSPYTVAVVERRDEVAVTQLTTSPPSSSSAAAAAARQHRGDKDMACAPLEHGGGGDAHVAPDAATMLHVTQTTTEVTVVRSPRRQQQQQQQQQQQHNDSDDDDKDAAQRSPSLRSLHRESIKPTRHGGGGGGGCHAATLLRRLSGSIDYHGGGPAALPCARSVAVYPCFDEANGLLFRLEDALHHTWYFYNDTAHYCMHVTATFGHESMVTALGNTTQQLLDRDTGHCTLSLDVGPGETQPFMRGEYNGFVVHYDAEPLRGPHRRAARCC